MRYLFILPLSFHTFNLLIQKLIVVKSIWLKKYADDCYEKVFSSRP